MPNNEPPGWTHDKSDEWITQGKSRKYRTSSLIGPKHIKTRLHAIYCMNHKVCDKKTFVKSFHIIIPILKFFIPGPTRWFLSIKGCRQMKEDSEHIANLKNVKIYKAISQTFKGLSFGPWQHISWKSYYCKYHMTIHTFNLIKHLISSLGSYL